MTQNKYVHAKVLSPVLGASLWLFGCSLSLPDDGELFAPPRSSTDDKADSNEDAATGSENNVSDAATGGKGGNDGDGDGFDAGVSENSDAGSSEEHPGEGDAGDTTEPEPDAGPREFDPEEGLILHYRFNESTGNTVHDFAGDNDALVVGTPDGHEQWVAQGRVGGALQLVGGPPPETGTGHYVELPPGILLGLEEVSISMWINRSGGPMWQRVFDLGSGQPVWLFFTPYGGNGLPIVAGRTPGLIFVDFVPIADAGAGVGELKINKPIPVSTWVHFALTWNADEIRVYLDGELVASATVNGRVTPSDLGNTGQNYLGRSQFESDPYFQGLIDEFRIYNRVLSASDVAKLRELN